MKMDTELKDGFLNIPENKNIDLISEIKKLKKEKNAVILAHYYVDGEIQDIADFVGDSLALSQQAASTKADLIVFAGVHFMGETAKILSPKKKVVMPDLNAGCSLADSCPTEDFAAFKAKYPGYVVVSYVNTTAEIKALSDIICTSSNAKEIIESLPEGERVIFGPDKNLGNYIAGITNREMVVWQGACHVHKDFSLPRILELKKENPEAKIIAHPECPKEVLLVADFIGSTSALLKYTIRDNSHGYIVATESGILHQMRKANPDKVFLAAPPEDATCSCNDCMYMKMNTLWKVYISLKYEKPEIQVDPELAKQAKISIDRMMEISNKLGL